MSWTTWIFASGKPVLKTYHAKDATESGFREEDGSGWSNWISNNSTEPIFHSNGDLNKEIVKEKIALLPKVLSKIPEWA